MTNQQTAKHLTQTAMVTALIIVLGFFPGIPIGFIPVPVILQNMGIFLAAELFGTVPLFECSLAVTTYSDKKNWANLE